jgi:hypothetical protein
MKLRQLFTLEWDAIAGGLLWLAILLVLTLSDFMSRGWLLVFTRFEA